MLNFREYLINIGKVNKLTFAIFPCSWKPDLTDYMAPRTNERTWQHGKQRPNSNNKMPWKLSVTSQMRFRAHRQRIPTHSQPAARGARGGAAQGPRQGLNEALREGGRGSQGCGPRLANGPFFI